MEQEGIQDQQKDSLTELAERFRSWRAERKLGSKIPEQLWDQVCKLEPEHGFGACQLNYTQFRRRLGLPVSERGARKAAGTVSGDSGRFLEVGSLQRGLTGEECCIEVDVPQRYAGERLERTRWKEVCLSLLIEAGVRSSC